MSPVYLRENGPSPVVSASATEPDRPGLNRSGSWFSVQHSSYPGRMNRATQVTAHSLRQEELAQGVAPVKKCTRPREILIPAMNPVARLTLP